MNKYEKIERAWDRTVLAITALFEAEKKIHGLQTQMTKMLTPARKAGNSSINREETHDLV